MNASSPLPQPRRRAGRWILFAFAIVGIVACLLVSWFAVWRSRLRHDVNVRVAAIRAAGLPTNWEELNRWYKEVPEAENAAFIYTNAIAHLHSNTIAASAEYELPPRGLSLSDELRARAWVAVQTNQAALEIAYRAGTFPKSRYPVDFLDGVNTPLPHLGGLKRLGKLLECEAVLKAEAGDAISATRAVRASLAVAHSLDTEPGLASQLVALSMVDKSCLSLERVLCRTPLSNDDLLHLTRDLAAAEATNRIVTGLIGDRAIFMELIRLAQDDVRQMIEVSNQNQPEEEKTDLPSRDPGLGWRLIGFFERDRAFFLRAMETNLLIAAMPPPASLATSNQTDQIQTEARKGFYFFSGLLLPSLSRLPWKDASLRARLRTAQVAVALERWRATHAGTLPDSLDALVPDFLPAIPHDPYDGQALRFKRLPQGYVVYSIGPDRRDDGGREQPPRKGKVKREDRDRYDITFTVER